MQLPLTKRISSRLRAFYFSLKKNIKLGPRNHVFSGAKIESLYGGCVVIGKENEILNGVLIQTYGGDIKIGDYCSINPYTIIQGHGSVSIGNNVLIAGHCMIIPSNHNFSETDIPIGKQGATSKGIVIEGNVWIGHGCSILDGVTIGSGSVIGAGSVVNKDIEPFSVAAGNPVKILKKRINC